MTPRWSSADFDVPAGVTYLNAAGAGPRLHAVSRAGRQALRESAAPWRVSQAEWEAQTERLRSTVAELLETDADALAFCPSVSYGMAVAARNLTLAKGQSVVVLAREHPSNRSVWQRTAAAQGADLCEADPLGEESWTDAVLRTISDRTAVVCIPQVHWTQGAPLDLSRIHTRVHELGAALVIDASQSLGAMALDWTTVDPDFVIAPGHKWLLGAYGLGWLWAAPRWRECGQPLEHNLVAHAASGDYSQLRAPPPFRPGARRFDFGASAHPLLIPMAQAAATQLQTWGMVQVQTHLAALMSQIIAAFRAKGLADGLQPSTGHFCAWAPPQGALASVTRHLDAASIILANRDGRLRIAPHLHVDRAQIEHLANTLAAAV